MATMTKVQAWEEVKNKLASLEGTDELIAFVDKEIGIIQRHVAKTNARRAKKREEGDVLQAKVLDVITEAGDWVDGQTITLKLIQLTGDEALTKAKVQARCNNLFNNGVIEKTEKKFESGNRMCYKLVTPTADE